MSVTDLSRRLDVCSVTQQQLDDWNTTLLAGDVQRREAVLSHVHITIDICSFHLLDQSFAETSYIVLNLQVG